MARTRPLAFVTGLVCALLWMAPDPASGSPVNGRFSLFSYWSSDRPDEGEGDDRFQLVGRFRLRSPSDTESRFEYAVDLRASGYPSEERDGRYTIYQAYVGGSFADQRFHLRLGQMWLHEMGGLGSVSGLLAEYRQPGRTALGSFRAGIFGGVELEQYDVETVENVKKAGAYAVLEGDRGRHHVLGYVLIRNSDITERSVITFTNFIPVGSTFFLYQAAEVDLENPAGVGDKGLTYFLINGRLKPVRFLELYATYHRGRSIDARTLAEDQLEGRPLDPQRLEGYLFETAGGRLTIYPARGWRLWGGYFRDTFNRGEPPRNRYTYGFSSTNLFRSGIDLTVSGSKVDGEDRSFDAYFVSLGRSFGRRLYLSLGWDSTVSVFRYTQSEGGVLEISPETNRYYLSANVTLPRSFSFLLGAELLEHDSGEEIRTLLGLTYRF